MRTIYLRRGLARLPDACRVLHVRPLLRELIVEIVNRGELRARDRVHEALCRLLIAELTSASSVATTVSLPKDPRAVAIARQFVTDPGLRTTLATLCAAVGVSVRTLERAFRKETGLDFESWRRQLRVMRAVEMLVGGRSVKEVAFSVGLSPAERVRGDVSVGVWHDPEEMDDLAGANRALAELTGHCFTEPRLN